MTRAPTLTLPLTLTKAMVRRMMVEEVLWATLKAHPESQRLKAALRDPPRAEGLSSAAADTSSLGSIKAVRPEAVDETFEPENLPGLPDMSALLTTTPDGYGAKHQPGQPHQPEPTLEEEEDPVLRNALTTH